MSDTYFDEEEFEQSFDRQTLWRIIKLLRPHWKWTLGFMVSIAMVSLIESVFTFIDKLIIDEGLIAQNPERLAELALLYGGVMLLQAVGVLGFIFWAGFLGHRVQYDLRKKMFDRAQELSLEYYNQTPVGWMISRVTSDSERIADLVSWGFLDVVWAVLNVSISLVFMFSINATLTLVILPVIPLLIYVAIWFKQRILKDYRKSRKFNSKITGNYNEMITGVRVIKALNRERTMLGEFQGLTKNMFRHSYRAQWYSALFLPAVQMISALAVGAVVLVGGFQTEIGGMTIGGIQAFVVYITFMMWPIQDLARVYAGMQHAIASAERCFSLIDQQADIVDKTDAFDPGTIQGDITFENVTFYYEENKPVLTDFSLDVKQGETIALVGQTGGGKSTIVNLICRFYEPVKGHITIGGTDYTDFTQHALQSRIGIVLQTPHLFSGVLKDNIRYGRLDATDEEIIEAAKIAGAHDFIANLPKGYDEQVGEGGTLLSVGQKQLISLARAVLSDPEIFIMDEATSSVDTLTEDLIQKGMEKVMEGRTSFVIAHRLSTIKRANRILVIENGRIIEQGSHRELLRQQGHYHNLYTKQFRQEAKQELEDAYTMKSAGA